MSEIKLNNDYITLINHLKEKVKSAQLKAALSVNQAVIELYWYIGKKIIEKQQQVSWGSKLIESMAHDLQNAFPKTHGFSKRNLERMRQFSELYLELDFAAQTVPQLPWGHIVLKKNNKRSLILQTEPRVKFSRFSKQNKLLRISIISDSNYLLYVT